MQKPFQRAAFIDLHKNGTSPSISVQLAGFDGDDAAAIVNSESKANRSATIPTFTAGMVLIPG